MSELSEREKHIEEMTDANRIGWGNGNVFEQLRENLLRAAGLLLPKSRVGADLFDTMHDDSFTDADAPEKHRHANKVRKAAVAIKQKIRDGD